MEGNTTTSRVDIPSADSTHTRRREPPPLTVSSALYLDFDGTLVELASTPDRVECAPSLLPLLATLHQLLDGALAIITGRRLESVDPFLAPLTLCGAGLHGAQIRLQSSAQDIERAPPEMRRLAAELATHFTRVPGVLIEDKGGAVALHYRLAPERADECQGLMRRLAAAYGLDTIMGHCVIEARPAGINKGLGLHRLSEAPPFFGRVPIFVGDDTTDEDAILVAQALGGSGIRVGSQPSAAQYRLKNVSAVHRWLADSITDIEAAR